MGDLGKLLKLCYDVFVFKRFFECMGFFFIILINKEFKVSYSVMIWMESLKLVILKLKVLLIIFYV